MNKLSKLFFLTAIIAAIIIATDSAFAQSCPMCKESMTQSGEKLSNGFYYSIMSMFTLPISLIGAGTVFVMKSSWKRSHPDSEGLSTMQILKEIVKERRERK